MYKGEAYLHEDRIDSVIRTAELLQIKGLCESPKNIVLNDNTNLRGNSSLGKLFLTWLSLRSRVQGIGSEEKSDVEDITFQSLVLDEARVNFLSLGLMKP